MVEEGSNVLRDLVRHVGRYPDDAFLFVREGLAKTAEHTHGTETDAHRRLYRYLAAHHLDWSDLVARYQAGELPRAVVKDIEAAGGCGKLNRHLTGRELCCGLRDYAIARWGMMARVVLAAWNIRETADFGRIVFGFIEFNIMQKQPEDSPDDFNNVFDFGEAFDKAFDLASDSGKDAKHTSEG